MLQEGNRNKVRFLRTGLMFQLSEIHHENKVKRLGLEEAHEGGMGKARGCSLVLAT